MRNRILLAITFCFILFNCEEKIDVDVPFSGERLVVEASINWFEGNTGNEQEITLTKTAPYFNNEIPPALNATVTVKDSNNTIYNFIDNDNSGVYKTTNFIPNLNETYELEIIYNNETYTATETLLPVVPIDFVEQKDDGGFSGEEIELKAFYTDPANEANFYFFEFESPTIPIKTLETYEDEFSNGNQIFAFYSDEDLEPNNNVNIKHYGVSEQFYEYMYLLLEQIGDASGGPFQTQPATVRGNIINTTNTSNFALGYFRLSQAFNTNYTIQ